MSTVRCRVVVRGRVQGVFFREAVRRQALAAGVTGWVQNRADGAVEAVFEGAPERVESVVALCRQGPPQAEVQAVECFDEPPEGIGAFRVR